MEMCISCKKDVRKVTYLMACGYCKKCLKKEREKNVNCVQCEKNVKVKDIQMIMYRPHCRKCADIRSKNAISFEDTMERAESGEDALFLEELKDGLNKMYNKKKKIRLRNVDKTAELKILILNLILLKKFKEAKDLGNKYETPVGYDMINDYKEGMTAYKKNKSKLTEKRKKEIIEYIKKLKRKWKF